MLKKPTVILPLATALAALSGGADEVQSYTSRATNCVWARDTKQSNRPSAKCRF